MQEIRILWYAVLNTQPSLTLAFSTLLTAHLFCAAAWRDGCGSEVQCSTLVDVFMAASVQTLMQDRSTAASCRRDLLALLINPNPMCLALRRVIDHQRIHDGLKVYPHEGTFWNDRVQCPTDAFVAHGSVWGKQRIVVGIRPGTHTVEVLYQESALKKIYLKFMRKRHGNSTTQITLEGEIKSKGAGNGVRLTAFTPAWFVPENDNDFSVNGVTDFVQFFAAQWCDGVVAQWSVVRDGMERHVDALDPLLEVSNAVHCEVAVGHGLAQLSMHPMELGMFGADPQLDVVGWTLIALEFVTS